MGASVVNAGVGLGLGVGEYKSLRRKKDKGKGRAGEGGQGNSEGSRANANVSRYTGTTVAGANNRYITNTQYGGRRGIPETQATTSVSMWPEADSQGNMRDLRSPVLRGGAGSEERESRKEMKRVRKVVKKRETEKKKMQNSWESLEHAAAFYMH